MNKGTTTSIQEQNRLDYIQFVDGGSRVPFHISDGKYVPTKSISFKNDLVDFENKVYFKDKSHNYYVTTRQTNNSRVISAGEYKYVIDEINKQSEKFKKEQKKQLEFVF